MPSYTISEWIVRGGGSSPTQAGIIPTVWCTKNVYPPCSNRGVPIVAIVRFLEVYDAV